MITFPLEIGIIIIVGNYPCIFRRYLHTFGIINTEIAVVIFKQHELIFFIVPRIYVAVGAGRNLVYIVTRLASNPQCIAHSFGFAV